MSPTTEGLIVLIVTLLILLSGIPVAFGLGAISIVFLLFFQGFASMHVVAETFLSGLDEFTLVAIPMFVMMGAAIGSSPAGKDLYEALDRWLYRLPGGLAISNIGACAIFAALTGSSPACCAAIGKMGIPEMRRRGYPDGIATGSICAGGTLGILIPPSVTFILYGIATETSIGRLFIAGVLPGIMLTGLFILWTLFAIWRSGFRSHAADFRYSWKEKFAGIPKITPFIAIVVGVMYVLYGGIATPSEAAGVGAGLCLVLALVIYRLWQPHQVWAILRDHHGGGLRSGVVWRYCHHQYGNRPDPSAGWPQSLHRQRNRARRPGREGDVGNTPLCCLHDAGDRDSMLLPPDRDLVT
jgi:tripartite ATP-independent transporter DctM subunit